MPSAKAPVPNCPSVSARSVHANFGRGTVKLYDARIAVTAVMPAPEQGAFDKARWVLVHFPSRHWIAVKSKALALSMLSDIRNGTASWEVDKLIPKDIKPPARDRADARKKPALTPPTVEAPPAPPKADGEQEKPKGPQIGWTPVPEGLDFDKAMKLVFPVQRITQKLEALLTASTPIYSDGAHVGDAPAHQTQLQALKTLIEYHVGKAIEKEKTKEVKPPLTLQELRAKMVLSDEYRAGILEMAADCAKEAEARKAKK